MIRSTEEFTSAFQAARCVSTPLVAIRTAGKRFQADILRSQAQHLLNSCARVVQQREQDMITLSFGC
jgi:hypothetical protein